MSRRTGAPWKHRPHHRAFWRLSAAARQRAVDGFRRNEPTTAIVEGIAGEHGETIPISSLNRYREWWTTAERPMVEASMKVEEVVRGLQQLSTPELERHIRDLLLSQRMVAMAEDKQPDPVELGHLDLKERKLRLQERALALRERELERRVQAAAGKVEKELKRAKLDPATIARIKEEVYGLAS